MNCIPFALVVLVGLLVLLGMVVYSAMPSKPPKAAPIVPTDEDRKRRDEKVAEIKAEGKEPTHIVEGPDGIAQEAVCIGNWWFVSKFTGRCIERPLKVVRVLADQPHKAELLALFDKMVKASNVKSAKTYAGMGSEWWSIGLVDRFGGEGPALRIMGAYSRELCLTPNGPKAELTTDEIDRIKAMIEERQNPVTTVETIESMLHV